MNQPFGIEELPANLKKLYNDCNGVRDWDPFITELKKIGTERPLTDIENLSLAYSLVRQATSIDVDDVPAAVKQAMELMANISSDNRQTLDFRKTLTTIQAAVQENEEKTAQLLVSSWESLSDQEKSRLAFDLSDRGGLENQLKAADLYWNLYETGPDHSRFYNFCSHGLCLYEAGQYTKADLIFEQVKKWSYNEGVSAYPYFIASFFYQKLKQFEDDPPAFVRVWEEALANEVIKKDKPYFPFAMPIQDLVLRTAVKHKLTGIQSAITRLIREHRKPGTIPADIQQLLGD